MLNHEARETMHSKDDVIAALSAAPSSGRWWSIAEIATLIGEKPQRVRAHFDRYRSTLFPPTNNPNGNQKRQYDLSAVKRYVLFLTLSKVLNHRGYQAERLLQTADLGVLWEKYQTSVQALGSFAIEQQLANA